MQWLARTADGNPFVVEELLRGALDNGALVETDGRWQFEGGEPQYVPMALVDAVADRAAAWINAGSKRYARRLSSAAGSPATCSAESATSPTPNFVN
ncbi:hypothetical protein ACFQ9X_30840 [Catenulispora yoronensis]